MSFVRPAFPGKPGHGQLGGIVHHPLRAVIISGAALALAAGLGTAAPALAATHGPAVLHVGQIDRQDVAPRLNCEQDTLVEPHVAVSPFNPNIQVAVAHDCRIASGGAVDISYAWTHDGGAHWHHAPMPGLTKAVGGVWNRASDPVVAFGADGSVYVSSLVFQFTTCPTGVAVSRSTDGGATFGPPVLVQKSTTCAVSDDKNWLVADTNPQSPFYGRLYQFWTEFTNSGVPQVVRWSDDQGRHWSATHLVSAAGESTQNSQPVFGQFGQITDVYMSFSGGGGGGVSPVTGGESHGASPFLQGTGVTLVARTSFDGGARWSSESVVARNVGGGPSDIRCCLPLAAADPVTGLMYAVWNAPGPGISDPVELSFSANGRVWSHLTQVTHSKNPAIQYINAAVAANGGHVFVSYGRRNTAIDNGNLVQQELTLSTNNGGSFGPPLALGPLSNLKYAAFSGATFPGDYTGLSLTPARLTAVWCVSSKPANPNLPFNQTLYAATLRP
jgi:hypothetical protein